MATNKYDNQFHRKFSSLEKQLNRHEKRISIIMENALNTSRTDNKYWNSVRTELNKEYAAVSKLTSDWSKEEIPKQYRFVVKEQMARSKRIKSKTNQAKKSVTQLLNSTKSKQIQAALTQSAIEDINQGLALGRRDLNRLLGQTRQSLIAESVIDTGVASAVEQGNVALSKVLSQRGTVANKLLTANDNNRYITIINKNNEPIRYRISYYSEMVYRVKWHEAQSAAVRTNNANWGTDLIRVSSHNTTTEICQQYEGKVMSLTGKNKDFPIADQLPPYHVNCLHYITTTFEEALKVQGVYNEYAQFSNNEASIPPGQTGFVPVKDRNKIANESIAKTKKTTEYQDASPKKKSKLLRANIGKAINKAAA